MKARSKIDKIAEIMKISELGTTFCGLALPMLPRHVHSLRGKGIDLIDKYLQRLVKKTKRNESGTNTPGSSNYEELVSDWKSIIPNLQYS